MKTNAEAVPAGRLVTIDGDGRLRTPEGPLLDAPADELYAIVVVWHKDAGATWVGWLITSTRRTARFAEADLEDPIVQGWLRTLPGWETEKLSAATTCPGVHLVWRRPATMPPP
jgi:hypothetical protein